MTKPFANRILDYWRNSLADAARVEIKLDKVTHLKKGKVDYEKGRLDLMQSVRLIDDEERKVNKAEGIEESTHKDWKKINQVQVLLSPFRVDPSPEFAKITGEEGSFYPFWIKALLNRKGELSLDEDTFPYIPRPYLEPQVNDNVNFVFSQVDRIDEAFAHPFNESSWPAYWTYITNTFTKITGSPLDTYTAENFYISFENTVAINSALTNAADAIIRLYDHFRKEKSLPALLKTHCNDGSINLKDLLSLNDFEEASLRHLGQMGYEFPLSYTQRQSLYHFNTLKKGEILAINGPPGTGKTTLLQSIVANEVVHSALAGENPHVILACSTNNQAVTNINDSFAAVKNQAGIVYQRWIQNIHSFALYLPARNREVSSKIPYYKGLDDGIRTVIETYAFINEAKKKYCASYQQYSGNTEDSISSIVSALQDTLVGYKELLKKGVAVWKNYKQIPKLITDLGAEQSGLLSDFVLDGAVLAEIEDSLKNIERQISDYLNKESFWIRLLAFLNFKFAKEGRAARLKAIFRNSPVPYTRVDFYKMESIHAFFDEKHKLIKKINDLQHTWIEWKKENGVKGNPPLEEKDFKTAERKKSPFFYDELETSVKNDMFYLAIHYWEGRWIIEAEKTLDEKRERKNGEEEAPRAWQRLAMLFPCFVSTFYMAPKFISYSKFVRKASPKDIFENPPLTEFVDLLIVDEAGQVSPEIGAATFGLAKKAIVVGDTKQLEPVYNVPGKVDYANLHRFELIHSIEDNRGIEKLSDQGFLASNGSVMKMAQKSSFYKVRSTRDRGMMLTEHRRCFDEIISYCNTLAYYGALQPKKGPAKNTLFQALSFNHVDGESERINSSRANRQEANAIALWVKQHSAEILEHYQQKEQQSAANEGRSPKSLALANIIGIVTPFTAQKWTIHAALSKHQINRSGLTIGTVHALQGAEREIILFSSVYGENDIGLKYFFDAGVNMLNVAVSRAKENFILFGNTAVFLNNGAQTPSSLLYHHIQKINSTSVLETSDPKED